MSSILISATMNTLITQPKMEISDKFPPNFAKVKAKFPDCEGKAIFCYGETIYNPFKLPLRPDTIEHESIHAVRQGADPEAWWDRYMADPKFLVDEEIPAFSAQYEFMKKFITNKESKIFLDRIARVLSSELYGSVISFQEAHSRVRSYSKQ